MTGFEAAIQEDCDDFVRRRRNAKQAQDDEDYRLQDRKEAVARIIKCHSQREQSLPPSPAPGMPQPLSPFKNLHVLLL